jgi:type IV secretion system protein TrbL
VNTGIADQFLDVFAHYIDSGFGLLGGEVAFLASTLVAIDVTLAALFWSWSSGDDIIARLIKKTLYVGFFAFLLSNFNGLARVLFESFSGLGLKAAGSGLTAQDFLHPGKIAQAGIDAGKPLLESAQQMCGFPAFFDNFPKIIVLLLGWAVILVAFFVLAVQLFVTLIEFKLTTLAGFVLVPFGLFGKTAFLAERVLGNVVAAGVKVLVLAVIVGIGSTLFSGFVQDFGGDAPNLEQVLSLALGALCLLGLGIFGPAIANGLVSGAPQLGAGAAVGAGLAAGGMFGAAALGGRAAIGAGVAGARKLVSAGRGERPGPTGSGDGGWRPNPPPGGGSPPNGAAPAWAQQYRRRQDAAHAASTAVQAVRSGDHAGGGASVSLAEDRS